MFTMKKILVWLKSYWYIPLLLIYTLILWLVFRKGSSSIALLQGTIKSYKSQIEALEKLEKEKAEKKEEIEKKYNELLSKIEKKYKEDNIELDNKKKKRIKTLIEKHTEEQLVERLKEEFGI